MNTVFMISGGAGRVVAAIPALEKYERLNPDDNFKVIIHGWEQLFWSHPTLQKRTLSIGQKGIFEDIIRESNLVVPEPYHRHSYYNQQTSLAEAFDEEINKTDDHSDLEPPNLYIQSQERYIVRGLLNEEKAKRNQDKVIVFQPYGSGMGIVNGRPYDASMRSLDVDDYLKLGKELSKHAVIVFFGPKELQHPGDDFSVNFHDKNPDLRMYMSLIAESDYLVGCDSVGQHMAMAFRKPGTVFMGSTFEKNVTYPDHFRIIRNGMVPTYNPIRIGGIDSEMADRMNDRIMNFTDAQLEDSYKKILTDIYGDNLPAEAPMASEKWKSIPLPEIK
jgi:ADP-heptose:LPS heptosyltransferase